MQVSKHTQSISACKIHRHRFVTSQSQAARRAASKQAIKSHHRPPTCHVVSCWWCRILDIPSRSTHPPLTRPDPDLTLTPSAGHTPLPPVVVCRNCPQHNNSTPGPPALPCLAENATCSACILHRCSLAWPTQPGPGRACASCRRPKRKCAGAWDLGFARTDDRTIVRRMD
jgi:hypothetical protein